MPLAAAVLLAASGCGGEDDSTRAAQVPTFEGSIDLEIGEIQGEDPYLFGRIGSVAADAGGRLIVTDFQTHDLRVFDPEGRFVFRFGGQGEGPGELTNPCCLAFGPDGALWVREGTRYSAFRLEAASALYDGGLRTAHAGVAMVAPVTFDSKGRLVNIGTVTAEAGESVMARLHRGPGAVVDTVWMSEPDVQAAGSTTVPLTVGDMQAILYVYQPFGPRWLHAHGPGGAWAETVSSAYSVTLHRRDGTVLQINGSPLPGPPLSPDEQRRAQAAIDRDLGRLGLRDHPFEIPDTKPPLAALFFDRVGRLWVEKTAADEEKAREADVYDEGTLVARYRWPRRVVGETPWVTESTLYGKTRDSLDVERVARVRFKPTGG